VLAIASHASNELDSQRREASIHSKGMKALFCITLLFLIAALINASICVMSFRRHPLVIRNISFLTGYADRFTILRFLYPKNPVVYLWLLRTTSAFGSLFFFAMFVVFVWGFLDFEFGFNPFRIRFYWGP
jgi:hypothetical protein